MKSTIFKRLAIGHVIILAVAFFISGYVIIKLKIIYKITYNTAAIDGKRISTLEHLLSSVFSLVMFEKKYLISMDDDYYNQFQELQDYFEKDMAEVRELISEDEYIILLNRIQRNYETYIIQFNNEIEALKNNTIQTVQPNYENIKKEIISNLNNNLNQIIKMIKEQRDSNITLASQIAGYTLQLAVIMTLITIGITFFISFFNTKTITSSIYLLKKKTEEISEGKFEKIDIIQGPIEIQDLASHFNIMCERLQELDRLKADFISSVSHLLRTPLTSIREASKMLNQGLYVEQTGKRKELFNLIHEECERLIRIVNNILDISKLEGRMMEYNFAYEDLIQIIRHAMLKLFPLVEKKKIDLELIPPPALPLLKLDKERIEEVMENLLGNALKFTSSGGKIVVKVDPASVENDEITVCVTDNGCGIKAENVEDIFDKYKIISNGDESQKDGEIKQKHTGLGLSISKHIITAHGGKIWAESTYKKGTSVFFSLPVPSSSSS